LAILLPIQIGLVQIISQYPSFVENYYSQGIYPFVSRFLRIAFGWIPFSVGDILLVLFLLLLFRFVYRLFKTKFKQSFQQFIKLIASLSVIYFCFYFFWGLNYYRNSLAENLQLKQAKYTTKQLVILSNKLIAETNKIQLQIMQSDTLQVINPYRSKEMYQIAIKGYNQLATKHPQFSYKSPSIKNSLMSKLQSYNGTSGYLNPLTGEAQVNNYIPKNSIPFVVCHEIAHQIGWAAENEANFIGFLAAINNKNIYFKYAGYKMATRYVIYELYKQDKELYKTIFKTINVGVKKDFKESFLFWEQHKNPFEPIIKKGYNAYLKANKQKNGIQSYNYVVDLLIAFYHIK